MDHISPALFELVPVHEGVDFEVIFLLYWIREMELQIV